MDRKVAIGIIASTLIFTSAFVAIALTTVISRPTANDTALDAAQTAAKSAVDAPRTEVARPSATQKPAAASLAAPFWIWSRKEATKTEQVTLMREFTLDAEVRSVKIVASVDNFGRVLLDGREVATTDDWALPADIDLPTLAAGKHTLSIEGRNDGGPAGACAMNEWSDGAGVRTRIGTDGSWKSSSAANAAAVPAVVIAKLGETPWGDAIAQAFGGAVVAGDIDRSITVPAGFICELVYVAPKARGSIVAMTPDARGRLIVSAQYGRVFAVTPCQDAGDAASSKVDIIEPEIGRAHGLLSVDNDLFAVVNEGSSETRGIWRLRDNNNDGIYDEKKMLASVARDGGEHGPHQVVLAPDGSIWIVGGNHCAPPEQALEHSRIPKLWQEDVIFSRLWDPNGHAVGVMAPGGWVVRTDREGAKWELMTAGFRNSYDLAFDELGRAFTYDSDMEWDMGLPWYRPTRICELASGVDYGWRSGSGKWPAWSPESMPSAADVGPASPTGVLASQGLMFPPPWNDCMFFLDWTFGTMWAGWPTDESKDASTPKLRVEPFIVGRPLPLTDAVVMNGAMYFAVGGRNLPSAVYRVRAENPIAIKRAAKEAPAALVERREIEKLHERMSGDAANAAVARVMTALSSSDAGVRSAARIALEHQDPSLWRARAIAETSAQSSILALVALARAGDPSIDGSAIASRLVELEPTVRDTILEKEWLRACELWFLRIASSKANEADAANIIKSLCAHFPAEESNADAYELDMHRAALLAKLGDPRAVEVAVALLDRPDVRTAPKIDAALLARGGPYGKAVADIIANAPATQKIGMVHAMRDAKNGWNPALRAQFARDIANIRKGSGGNSFAGFLNHMTEEFVANAPEAEREMLVSVASGKSANEVAVVMARGPGRVWTVESIVALGPKLVAGRDYNEGLRAYRAAQCAQCHRVGSIGGSGGPELTAVSRRFSLADLALSLVDPSKTVSDQYQNTDITLKNGKIMTGRIVSDSPDAIELRTSLLSEARDTIKKSDIASRAPSKVSPMLEHLHDGLNEGEMLDLLAFLRSGGDAADVAFAGSDDDGYLEIFSSVNANGKTADTALAPFTYDPKFWSIENGEAVGRTTAANPAPHNTFLIWNGEVRDFELEVEFQVHGNNAGVQYRSVVFDHCRMRGPQIDSHPNPPYVGMMYEEGGRGILAERLSKVAIAADGTRTTTPFAGESEPAADITQWHTYRVVARGPKMTHYIDGDATVQVIDESKERAVGGSIGLQIHAGEPMEVRMRKMRLRRLDG